MTVADLSVGRPGRPDAGTEDDLDDAGEEMVYDDAGEPAPRPITIESVKGLVMAATEMLHRMMVTNYPERPEIALMTDAEAERVAGALVSMAARNAGLRRVLERSDIAVLMVTLAGYTGRLTSDMAGAKRERRDNDPNRLGPGSQGPGSAGAAPSPGGGPAGGPGDVPAPGGAPGQLRPPAHS